jgi:hypothetical protein
MLRAEKAAAAAAAAEDLKNPRSGSGGTLRTPRPVTGIGSMAIAAAAVAQSNASALNNHTSPSARTPLTSLRPETDSRTRKLSVADTNKVEWMWREVVNFLYFDWDCRLQEVQVKLSKRTNCSDCVTRTRGSPCSSKS